MEKDTGQDRIRDESKPPDSNECISLEILSTGFQDLAEEQGKNAEKTTNVTCLPQNNPIVMRALSQNEDGDAYLFTELFRDKLVFDCSQKTGTCGMATIGM